MVNPYRGEIEAVLGGERRTLRLSLGALAELEAVFHTRGLMALANRIASPELSATDSIAILAAGLRGAGSQVSNAEVAEMDAEGGALGYARIIARLARATFGDADAD